MAKSEFSQPFRLQSWWRRCDPVGLQELWKRPRLHVGHSSWRPDSHWLTVAPSLGLAHCTCYLNLNREHQGEHIVSKLGFFFMLLNAAWERGLYPNKWKWRKWELSCNLFWECPVRPQLWQEADTRLHPHPVVNPGPPILLPGSRMYPSCWETQTQQTHTLKGLILLKVRFPHLFSLW